MYLYIFHKCHPYIKTLKTFPEFGDLAVCVVVETFSTQVSLVGVEHNVFNRPGVARGFLKTPPLPINLSNH